MCALSVYGLVHVNTGRIQERLDDLQLQLGLVLGTEFMSSGGSSTLLTTQPSLALHVFKVVFWKHAHLNLVSQIH